MTMKPLKEIIYKFEQLKSDFVRKINLAAQMPGDSKDAGQANATDTVDSTLQQDE